MGQFLVRAAVTGVALWIVTLLVSGIHFVGGDTTLQRVGVIFVVALIFGVINISVRPILKLLTFPLLIVTLGLFTFVLNALMLWLTAAISDALDLGFHVDGFRAAFVGALVVTVVSFLLSLFVRSGSKPKLRVSRDDD